MKVAQVCHRFYPHIGGIETHVLEISKRLVAQGIDVDILTTEKINIDIKQAKIKELNVIQFKSWAPEDSLFISKDLYFYLKKNASKYDIIHAHNYQALPALISSITKTSNKLITTPHYHERAQSFLGRVFYTPYKYIGSNIFHKSDTVICVSTYEKTKLIEQFNVPENKIQVIPNGINIEDFSSLEKNIVQKYILSVGRLEHSKGHQNIIKAIPYLDKEISYHLIGEGPYKNELFKLVDKLGLKDRVHFKSNITRQELIKEYINASIYISLSTNESFGITVGEALAAKTPCIVLTKSALLDWVDNKNCFGINSTSDEHLLLKLINKVINLKISKANIQGWDEVTKKVIEVYKNNLYGCN